MTRYMSSPKRRKKQLVLNQKQLEGLERISSHQATHVIGIDEVGIGCWAGPVVVAGVAVPKDWSDPSVDDSKELSPNKRERVLDQVILPAIAGSCLLSQPRVHSHGPIAKPARTD